MTNDRKSDMVELSKKRGCEPSMMMDFGQKALIERQLREMRKGNVISTAAAVITVVVVLLSLFSAIAGAMGGGGLAATAILAIVGVLVTLIGGIIYLIALYGLREVLPDYRTAFLISIGNVIASLVVELLASGSLLASLMDWVSSVLSLLVMWYVLRATGVILADLGREDLIQRGRTTWRLNVAATVGSLVSGLIPVTTGIVGLSVVLVFQLLVLLLAVVSALWYISYLGCAADAVRDSV